jgi:phosphoglucomutase
LNGSGESQLRRRFAILQKLTRAPGNGASIGGIKVVTATGWRTCRHITANLFGDP